MITKYSLGFMFSPDMNRVALIRKIKPEWQKNKFNGIGGKIEWYETPEEGMVREFGEETGIFYNKWIQFMILSGVDDQDFEVYCYYAVSDKIDDVKTMTDEPVVIVEMENLRRMNTIPNLQWLIPLAIDKHTGINYETRIIFNPNE